MITTLIVTSLFFNLVLGLTVYSLSKELSVEKVKIVFKEKIVYKDRPVEKIVYKDKIVEKVVYKDKPVHEFIKKEPKVSSQRKELLDALAELKAKKRKSKKDQETIYTIEKILPNIK